MQKKGRNISLASYEDIFSTEESRREAVQERVQEIPLSELHPFKGHPFKVVDDEAKITPYIIAPNAMIAATIATTKNLSVP